MMTCFGFRELRNYMSAKVEAGTPVAVYGASDDALMTLRHLRRDRSEFGLRRVAVIADGSDPAGSTVRGLSVYAGLDALSTLRDKIGIDEVVLPHNNLIAEEEEAVEKTCRATKIRCVRLAVSVDAGQLSVTGKLRST